MLSKLYGAAVFGVNAQQITIEVNVVQGTKLYMVGLPDSAVKESEHRIESALKTTGYTMPRLKTIVNLAPADVRKEGSAYDLPIALGVLQASAQIETELFDKFFIMGELALDGTVRPMKGVLPIAIEARRLGFEGFMLPKVNAEEAAIVNDLKVIGVESIREAIDYFEGNLKIKPSVKDTREIFQSQADRYDVDFLDVRGQDNIKRALEISAAGGHNVIMIGPPGSGKTMLAKRLPTILPPLTLREALETTKIHSVAGRLDTGGALVARRPFRSPHHTISDVALVGGGAFPGPGEISLAHNGVLFLDELPEFKRTVLEVMRQPLEERRVTISRAKFSVDFPTNFMLIASMNPCPCGYFNHPDRECVCAPHTIARYMAKISGPLLDRIDLHVEVTPVSMDEMTGHRTGDDSATIRQRVEQARLVQNERYKNVPNVFNNAMMPSNRIKELCPIPSPGKALLRRAVERMGLSARAYDRILKVSRTIADLGGSDNIAVEHLAEAIQYRSLDRDTWTAQ